MDYIGPSGTNYFDEWLGGLDAGARAAIISRLQYLKFQKTVSRPYWAKLKGSGKGLIEVRVHHRGVQYRPLCFHGPESDQITFVAGATERDDKFSPAGILKTAQKRKEACHESRRVSKQDF